MLSDPNIVVASDQLPGHPDGLIKHTPQPFAYPAPDIVDLRKKFDRSRDASAEARKRAEKSRRWYNGPGQLDSEVRATLKMRGQPAIYTNHIRPAINGILGVQQGANVDPRAYPRNPDDEEAADVASKSLRFIADSAKFDDTKLDCSENFWIEGVCAAMIECDGDNISVLQARFEEFFYDPRSRRPDFKDAAYLGFAQWLNTDFIRQMYHEQYAAMGDPLDSGGIGIEPTWEDRPENISPWISTKDRRILVVTLFYLSEGQWYRCVYCAAGVFEHDLTGYLDDKGVNICPLEATSYAVDNENGRYGHVQDMIPIQDEINARRSRLLHLANSRQIQEREQGASPVDAATARREAARADGIIPAGWQLVPTTDLAAGQQLLLGESKSELQRMAPTPATLGRDQGASSGRERLVLQQAGMTELARAMGRIEEWEHRCYKQMWWRAQQFWTGPKWVRVTDDLNASKFLQINEPVVDEAGQPVPEIDPQTGMPKLKSVVGPDGQPLIDPMTGQPQMQMVQAVRNRIADLDLDIIIQTVPDTANLQDEIFKDLMQLVQSVGIQAIFSPEFEIILEMSPVVDKARILERLKAVKEEGQQLPPEVMEAIQAMQAQIADLTEGQAAAEKEKTESETAENLAQVEHIAAQTLRTLTEPFKQQISGIASNNGTGTQIPPQPGLTG